MSRLQNPPRKVSITNPQLSTPKLVQTRGWITIETPHPSRIKSAPHPSASIENASIQIHTKEEATSMHASSRILTHMNGNTLIDAWNSALISIGMGLVLLLLVGIPVLLYYVTDELRQRAENPPGDDEQTPD
jgi:hypothetical protein